LLIIIRTFDGSKSTRCECGIVVLVRVCRKNVSRAQQY